MSCVTLLTAYGESGRSALVSRMGSSSSWTSPYSSLEPTARNRGDILRPRMASSTLIWARILVVSVSAGACHETPTKLWAAR